ncbi:hypothetical protein GCM10022243_42920 [Saccharothrix violaceirubra]|uniref:Uncharacterized protein n=1 Tax=Saccharothrix violaceirubra TaxID=413306 RepID=A0A7W7T5C7_9PSEU|nr:hypothetical protein [Saccharothrix violaceirubra]MBB4965580.1 hypothetical protein [Saccharothrix violaceirubra]
MTSSSPSAVGVPDAGSDGPPAGVDHVVDQAVDAVDRARAVLRASGDPVLAAVDSALSCAVSLIALRQRGPDSDIDPLQDALGAARALVGEVTFAVRDSYGPR